MYRNKEQYKVVVRGPGVGDCNNFLGGGALPLGSGTGDLPEPDTASFCMFRRRRRCERGSESVSERESARARACTHTHTHTQD